MPRFALPVRAAAVLLLAAVVCLAAEIKIPPSPDQWVTDTTGFLSAGTADRLNARLRAYQAESGHQVLVYIGKSTGGYPIEEFAVKSFEAWKPGRKGLDDGLVLFLMADDRKMRIEVGYGLEDKITDARAARIINEILAPALRSGDRDAGVSNGVESLLQVISGKVPPEETAPPAPRSSSRTRLTPLETLVLAAGGLLFLGLLITNPRLALGLLRLLFIIASSGGGGSGRGGGGGFSGGGGRSGGGGASGGW